MIKARLLETNLDDSRSFEDAGCKARPASETGFWSRSNHARVTRELLVVLFFLDPVCSMTVDVTAAEHERVEVLGYTWAMMRSESSLSSRVGMTVSMVCNSNNGSVEVHVGVGRGDFSKCCLRCGQSLESFLRRFVSCCRIAKLQSTYPGEVIRTVA